MRVLLLALVMAGCTFHIEGAKPSGSGTSAPGDPSAPPATGGTPANPMPMPTPTPPPAGTSGTPLPLPMTSDMATAATTPNATPDMTGVIHVGAACNTTPDCMEADLTCFLTLGKGSNAISLPGGYCSKACNSLTPCPTGGECVATFYGAFCMSRCGNGNNNGCRSGYGCCSSVDACGVATFCGGD